MKASLSAFVLLLALVLVGPGFVLAAEPQTVPYTVHKAREGIDVVAEQGIGTRTKWWRAAWAAKPRWWCKKGTSPNLAKAAGGVGR